MTIKGKKIYITKICKGKKLINNTDSYAYFFDLKTVKIKNGMVHISTKSFNSTDKFKLCLVSRGMKIVYNFESNTDVYVNFAKDFIGYLMIKVDPQQLCELIELTVENTEVGFIGEWSQSNTLLVSPGYPTESDRYLCGFVHTRALAYQKEGLSTDAVWVGDYSEVTIYTYQGVKVVRLGYGDLRELLYSKKYEKILIHFFNEKFAKVIDNLDLHDTRLYFYLHGAETLYRDWSKMCCPYFEPTVKLTEYLYDLFDEKDEVIKKYNNMPNVKWVFVTEWTKKHSEELVGIKYNNYDIIPCFIDTDKFKYMQKDPELRKKIFILRKFHDVNSYSIDLDVRAILELSRRACFNDLEFNIYGDGEMHDVLLAPVKKFPNVKIHKKFLTSDEIAEMHRNHGIALFATRYDSQAVSSCEAASSGCVVVSTLNPGILQEFDSKHNTLCNQECYKEYADVIERLYYNSDEFLSISKSMSEKIYDIYGYNNTIKKELAMFEADSEKKLLKPVICEGSDPILSIIIPAYNVSKYIRHTVWSLINQKNVDKIEILIINDGSKDDTLEISKNIAQVFDKTGNIIKVIDKENGGHGSVLNRGVSIARGKYIKIIDGDDTVNSREFEKLISLLQNEECDIVLNNFCEDVPYENRNTPQKHYRMLVEGIEYNFDDLCYEGYGFNVWGPLLSTSTYKTEMIKRRPFVTTEKMFYDDMEWNLNIYINCHSIKYYDLNIYNYLIGRAGQSISAEALKRNYHMHRQMVGSLLKIYSENYDRLSDNKKELIEKNIIKKMIRTHYQLIFDLVKSRKAFCDFDAILKNYPYFYNHCEIKGRKVKLFRITKGYFMWFQNIKAFWKR